MKRLFIVQHGLIDRHAHYYGETQGWNAVCRARGIAPLLYINRGALPDIVGEFSARAVFPHAPDGVVERDETCRRLSDFLTLPQRFAQACRALEEDGITAEDVMVVPYSTERDLFGAALWLGGVPVERRPTLVFIFHLPDLSWTVAEDGASVKGDGAFFRYAMNRLRAVLPPAKLVVYASTGRLAKILGDVFQYPCETSPQPTHYVDIDPLAAADEQTGPRVNVRLAGELRWEKGSDLAIPAILAAAERRPGTSFAVQVYDRRSGEAIAQQLAPLTATRSPCYVHIGQLGHELYQRRLVQSDILLLPYRWTRYALRASGVFSEALAFGLVTVVPGRTWMADMLNEGWGGGTIFAEPNVADVAAALVAALDTQPALSAQARRKAPEWRRTQTTGAVLDKIIRRLAQPDA